MISRIGDSIMTDVDITIHHAMIEPFHPRQVQPVSYDVRLGDSYKRLKTKQARNIARPSESEWKAYDHVDEIRIMPHEFLLACTYETVRLPPCVMAQLVGKSTVARQGLIIESAGLIDPGFEGQITLELHNLTDTELILPVGIRIGQLEFMHLASPPAHWYGQDATGSHYQRQMGATAPKGDLS